MIGERRFKEEIQMAKEKQHVFSARTTEAGLELLNELKDRLKIGWDELLIDGISAHYKIDKAVMSPPKKGAPDKAGEKSNQGAAVMEESPAPKKQLWRHQRSLRRERRPSKRRSANGKKSTRNDDRKWKVKTDQGMENWLPD
jgi:hypothetical protein